MSAAAGPATAKPAAAAPAAQPPCAPVPVVSVTDEPPFVLEAPEPAAAAGSAAVVTAAAAEPTLTRGQRMVSACSGALLVSLLVTPFDVIKTRMQAQTPVPRNGSGIGNGSANGSGSGSGKSASASASGAGAAHAHTHAHTHTHHNHSHGPLHPHSPAPPFGARLQTGLLSGSAIGSGGGSGGAAAAMPHEHVLSTPELIRRCTHYQYSNGLMDVWCLKCELPRPVSNVRFDGPIDTLLKIVRHEGPTNLWRGLAPTLVMSVPSTIVYFSAYDELKARVERSAAFVPAALAPLVAGTSARAFTTTLVSPLELIRTKLQAARHDKTHGHTHTHTHGTGHAHAHGHAHGHGVTASASAAAAGASVRGRAWEVIRSEIANTRNGRGVLNLWRGVAPTLWRDVPFSAIYWTSYEQLKTFYLSALMRRNTAPNAAPRPAAAASSAETAWAAFLSGASAGMFSAAMTHPFDVVKTRRQIEMYAFEIEGAGAAAAAAAAGGSGSSSGAAQNTAAAAAAAKARRAASSTGAILRTIWAEEGVRGLYTGLIARMAKVAPACAIMISTYEFAKSYFASASANAAPAAAAAAKAAAKAHAAHAAPAPAATAAAAAAAADARTK